MLIYRTNRFLCICDYFAVSHQYFGSDRHCFGLFEWREITSEFVPSSRIHDRHHPSYQCDSSTSGCTCSFEFLLDREQTPLVSIDTASEECWTEQSKHYPVGSPISSFDKNDWTAIRRLVSSLDDTVQNLVVDQPDISFIQENLAVSLIHQPSTRTKPVIGFAYGEYYWSSLAHACHWIWDPTRNAVLPISVDDAVVNLTSIVLTPRAAANQNRLIFSTFHQRNGLFDDDHSRLLTPMVSLMIDKPQTALNIGAVLKVDFQVEDSFSETNRSLKCAYWNLWANHTARWLTDGCQLTNRTKNSVTCMCEYRTHLAVLMVRRKPRHQNLGFSWAFVCFRTMNRTRHHDWSNRCYRS